MLNTIQKDLFQSGNFSHPAPVSSEAFGSRISFLERYRISLRLDQVLVLLMGIVVFHVCVFGLGMEKGKSLAYEQVKAAKMHNPDAISKIPADSQSQPLAPDKLSSSPQPISPQALPQNGSSSGRYTIQIVTYRTKAEADRLVQMLQKKGLQGFIVANGKYVQVCVQKFETQSLAVNALQILKSQGLVPGDAYVRSMSA